MVTGQLFSVPVTVRGYELDIQGHLNNAVYLQYAEHARWELLRAAGVDLTAPDAGLALVLLELTVRFHRELRGGDEVTVSCDYVWGAGKTFQIQQEIRLLDGSLAAEVGGTGGLLDPATRRLVADPRGRLRALAGTPELLGS